MPAPSCPRCGGRLADPPAPYVGERVAYWEYSGGELRYWPAIVVEAGAEGACTLYVLRLPMPFFLPRVLYAEGGALGHWCHIADLV